MSVRACRRRPRRRWRRGWRSIGASADDTGSARRWFGPLRRGCVLGLPLRGRGAEAFVVDVLRDRRMLAAGRAVRIAAQLDLAERRVERVEQEVPADERLTDA